MSKTPDSRATTGGDATEPALGPFIGEAASLDLVAEVLGRVDPSLQAVIDAALADARVRAGMAGEALVVISAAAITWPDGSLGCPQRGAAYSMALVPGFRVRIRAGEMMLDYHAGDRVLILCTPGRPLDRRMVEPRKD